MRKDSEVIDLMAYESIKGFFTDDELVNYTKCYNNAKSIGYTESISKFLDEIATSMQEEYICVFEIPDGREYSLYDLHWIDSEVAVGNYEDY